MIFKISSELSNYEKSSVLNFVMLPKQSLYSIFLLDIWVLKLCKFNLLMHNVAIKQ